MKRLSRMIMLLLAAGLILGLAACPTDAGDGGNGGTIVSFDSFTPPSIYVDNKSGERLVAFKGSLNPNNLISGIPAYASNHGLKKDPALFGTTSDFALILITEEQYNANKNNIAGATVFAEIYAFYNNEATNNNRFPISSKSGGSGRITLNNPTSWNIEIRRDGPTGEVLGYVASQMTNTVLRVNAPDDYSLYPVLKRYIPTEKEIYEAVPKYTSGTLLGKPYAKDISLTSADGTEVWNLSEAVEKATFNLSTGSFYLRIVNNANTAVRFTRGDSEQLTSMGIRGIPPANTNVYSIKIERNLDGTYPATETISQLKIGTPQNMLTVPTNTYKLDYVYTIQIGGADASNLTLGAIQESDHPLNIEAIFGF
jgi:hypothetical protein